MVGGRFEPWSDHELGHAADQSLTPREVALLTGRSVNAVQLQRRRLAAGWSPAKPLWSAEEDAFLASVPHFTIEEVARHLGRSPSAVRQRRTRLGIGRGVGYARHCDPCWVGTRTLLAKTCLGCGLLLGAEWFNRKASRKGHWESRCGKCSSAISNRIKRPDHRGPRPGKTAKLQAFSLEHASRNGQPWVEADFAVLADPDLLVIEKALRLGRTYEATHTMASKKGFKSKRGLGDPAKGVWRIVFDQQKEAA